MDSEDGAYIEFNPRRNTKANGKKGDAPNSLGNSEHERGNNRNPRNEIVAPAKRLKSFSSGSSTSSEDFIQVEPKVTNKPRASPAASPNNVHRSPRGYKADVSSDSGRSTGGTSQVSVLTHESLSYSTSLRESPPIQVMERPAGFDPNRIPPSIFVSKSPSPVDWSVASNESLFSIHIGNNSFSRDRGNKFSGELHKSGELDMSGDLPRKSGESYKSSEPIRYSPPPPVVRVKERDRNKLNVGRKIGETGVAAEEIIEDALIETISDRSKKMHSAQELSFNHHSDGRETGIQTVAFQKKKKHARSSWSCSNCSCGSCCSTWPSCCRCKSPSCDCCSGPSCNCCKWPSCRCCKLPSCSGCSWPSCSCCKWPSCSCSTCASCNCCKWPSCNGCCKWPSCSGCCKWPSCSCSTCASCNCCKWPSCSGCCKWPSCGGCCKWPSCSGCCKWPSCSSGCCKWPSCSGCCKSPSCSGCCKWPSCNCCKWPSCSCSTCPSCCCKLPSCSGCSWTLCRCWSSSQRKKSLTEGRHMKQHSEPKSSEKWYSCFFCCSNPC